ncbi:MAG TPA: DUF1801 domain-containing protein [Sphingomicrobium sp.]|nr:DUF1801 domain-containing protein [Sphingomicrobium sp.]
MGKYEAKTRPTERSVGEFLDSLEDPVRREDARRIDAMMRRVSGEEPRLWGPSIVGYGQYHYRYASGHEGDSARIAFSPRKSELVLYLMGSYIDRQGEADALLARLGKHRMGKSCLYIRRLEQVDCDVLEQLIRLNWRMMAEAYPD